MNALQPLIRNFSVGNWMQTLVFYAILLLMVLVILAQLDLLPAKLIRRES
ncbi:MAG TPA: hypothetical protein VHB54_09670 [Mucilaginibacter sp.]|nr:hypothetical protein [Mucilaginibacter sp.]HVW14081.1 hypothetical protein [Mucilaginibacter sp.]